MPLALAVMLVGGILVGMRLQSAQPDIIIERSDVLGGSAAGKGTVEELLRYVEARYVDSVNRNHLLDNAINRILGELDPHSAYIPPEQLQQENERLSGNFQGIGVEFMVLDDTVVVVAPISGGPAESAGIIAGDKIVEVEDSVIAGKNLNSEDVVDLLKGEKGTSVEIGILRSGQTSLKNYELTRAEIPVNSVDVSYMLNATTGYIKVSRFTATTDQEFIAALEILTQKRNMEDLVIDLRHNPGGYLQKATNLLSQLFRDKGVLLVYTEGKAVKRTEYKSSGRARFNVGDLVVLIDEGSASASEIVAGAIQDHDRGYLVGRRSFGKGLVQEQYPLSNGGALRLTVSRYYTPSGRSIQKPYDDREEYQEDFYNRYENGELVSRDSVAITDSTQYYTDNGRIVYGGGGIIPDFFVPLDTILLSDAFTALRAHMPNFAFRFVEGKRKRLEQMGLQGYMQEYSISPTVLREFLEYARDEGDTTVKNADLFSIQEDVKRFLKARIAKLVFGDEGFYRAIHQGDRFIEKALQVLRRDAPLDGPAALRKE